MQGCLPPQPCRPLLPLRRCCRTPHPRCWPPLLPPWHTPQRAARRPACTHTHTHTHTHTQQGIRHEAVCSPARAALTACVAEIVGGRQDSLSAHVPATQGGGAGQAQRLSALPTCSAAPTAGCPLPAPRGGSPPAPGRTCRFGQSAHTSERERKQGGSTANRNGWGVPVRVGRDRKPHTC
jgi:hypothetical protein